MSQSFELWGQNQSERWAVKKEIPAARQTCQLALITARVGYKKKKRKPTTARPYWLDRAGVAPGFWGGVTEGQVRSGQPTLQARHPPSKSEGGTDQKEKAQTMKRSSGWPHRPRGRQWMAPPPPSGTWHLFVFLGRFLGSINPTPPLPYTEATYNHNHTHIHGHTHTDTRTTASLYRSDPTMGQELKSGPS